MGYIRHRALIVTSWDDDTIEAAHAFAAEVLASSSAHEPMLPRTLTPITEPAMNGQRTFLIAPDGSKEFWDTSDAGDRARERIIAWLDQQQYGDGSSALSWALVQFGDDDHDNRLLLTDDDSLIPTE